MQGSYKHICYYISVNTKHFGTSCENQKYDQTKEFVCNCKSLILMTKILKYFSTRLAGPKICKAARCFLCCCGVKLLTSMAVVCFYANVGCQTFDRDSKSSIQMLRTAMFPISSTSFNLQGCCVKML